MHRKGAAELRTLRERPHMRLRSDVEYVGSPSYSVRCELDYMLAQLLGTTPGRGTLVADPLIVEDPDTVSAFLASPNA